MLAVVMFLNGLAVMVLEMAGARLLAPWMGTSIVVWTSLIGVILASLSLGYWMGGRLADSTLRPTHAIPGDGQAPASVTAGTPGGKNFRRAKGSHAETEATRQLRKAHARLAALLTGAAVCVTLTALLQGLVLDVLSTAVSSLHLATVCAALLLFAAPSILCGMVSPYAMRLAITSSETSGTIIGRLNAVSTVGSIAGTFLGGFILISWFGTMETILGVAGCLLAAACLAQARPFLGKALLAAVILLMGFGNHAYTAYQAEKGFLTLETQYSSLQIMDGRMYDRPARMLRTDPGSYQSGAFMDNHTELAFAYTRFYRLGTYLVPEASRILMLGGGGYSVPKWLLAGESGLASRDFSLDVVELDPGMTQAAHDYFWTPADDPRMTVYHEDARSFLNRAATTLDPGAKGPYQLIFADIFNSHYTVPFHVGTVEAAQKAHALLADDGVFLMNIITAVEGDNGRLLRSIRNAFASVFSSVYLFPVQYASDGSTVQNVMLLAFRTPRELPEPGSGDMDAELSRMFRNRWTRPLPQEADDVPPLRDNYAPVERYTLGFLP